MKAPDKLYLSKNIYSTFIYQVPDLDDETAVEYIRKDAFIEKACEYWYQYNRDIVKKYGAKAVLGCSEFTVNVEDFKKYMKGE